MGNGLHLGLTGEVTSIGFCEGGLCPGNLPLIELQLLSYRFVSETAFAAIHGFGELFQPGFDGTIEPNGHCVGHGRYLLKIAMYTS